MRPSTRADFQIAIICALPLEADAVQTQFDEVWDSYGQLSTDPNSYTTGRIGRHNVVLAYMPGIGKVKAAIVASNLKHSYENIQLALVVGICGAAPTYNEIEIILGDIIISRRIIEYDTGKQYPDGFRRRTDLKDCLPNPTLRIETFLQKLSTRMVREKLQEEMSRNLLKLQYQFKDCYAYPGTKNDILFEASYRHKHVRTDQPHTCLCGEFDSATSPVCDEAITTDCSVLGCAGTHVTRARLEDASPQHLYHIGPIASADTVMKSGEHRDRIAALDGAVGFEMEGAGVWPNLPCVVLKGVCDYADSHKSKSWQQYAAAAAACFTKAVLQQWSSNPTVEIQAGPCWSVPFHQDRNFVGRDGELEMILEGLFTDDNSHRMALYALGGMGKSSIALHIAYKAREYHPEYSIFWVACATPGAFQQSYRTIADSLKLPISDVKDSDVAVAVKRYLSSEKAGHWLIILDNADDINIWYNRSVAQSTTRLADYLPDSPTGSILLTTRDKEVARRFAPDGSTQLPAMGQKASLELFRQRLNDGDINEQSAETLTEKLCHHPLAIKQAAEYINTLEISIEDYLSCLRETEQTMVSMLSRDFEDDMHYRDRINPAAITWMVTIEQIEKQNPLAIEYLAIMSLMESKNIPQSLLPIASSTEHERLEAIACLSSFSFISRRTDNNFDMHRLVAIAMRTWLKINNKFQHHCRKVEQVLEDCLSHWSDEKARVWRLYSSHIQFFLAITKESFKPEDQFLFLYGQRMHREGYSQDAEPILADVLEKRQKRLGFYDAKSLDCMEELIRISSREGKWKEATRLCERLKTLRIEVHGKNHIKSLQVEGMLGMIYFNSQDDKKGQRTITKLLTSLEKHVGADDDFTSNVRSLLGVVYYEQGQWDLARKLQEQALEALIRRHGEHSGLVLKIKCDLADTHYAQGNGEEAERILLDVIHAQEITLGSRHLRTLNTVCRLGDILFELRKFEESEWHCRLAMEIYQADFGLANLETLYAMDTLGKALHAQGKLEEAKMILLELLEAAKKTYGERHFSYLESAYNLAFTQKCLGFDIEAIALLQHSIECNESTSDRLKHWQLEDRRLLAEWKASYIAAGGSVDSLGGVGSGSATMKRFSFRNPMKNIEGLIKKLL